MSWVAELNANKAECGVFFWLFCYVVGASIESFSVFPVEMESFGEKCGSKTDSLSNDAAPAVSGPVTYCPRVILLLVQRASYDQNVNQWIWKSRLAL